MDLPDEQWTVLHPIIPAPPRRPDGRGRPWGQAREVLNGILWGLRTGAPWKDLPDRDPPSQTCHRRLQRWVRSGIFEHILEALATDLRERGELELSEGFIDGTFVAAKKGGAGWERPRGAKGRRSWPWQTALVFLSPSTWPGLRRMRSPLVGQLSPRGLWRSDPSICSAIQPRTATRSTRAWLRKALS
jgi:transposase